MSLRLPEDQVGVGICRSVDGMRQGGLLGVQEWGNPAEKDYYDYIKSYSPVDNVRRTGYPNLLVTAGVYLLALRWSKL